MPVINSTLVNRLNKNIKILSSWLEFDSHLWLIMGHFVQKKISAKNKIIYKAYGNKWKKDLESML